MCQRPPAFAFAVESFAAAITFAVHLQDGCMMDEAVDGSERHRLLGEDLAPIAEWLIGGDQQGAAFVASGDQLERWSPPGPW